jgi:hypothetical protein
MHCRDVAGNSFVANVCGEFLPDFHAVAVKVVCGIDCLVCQDEFSVNNLLDVKENWGRAFDFALHMSLPFSLSAISGFSIQISVSSHVSAPNACLIITRAFVALFPRFSQNLMHTGCRIHREIASGQVYDSKGKHIKSQNVHPNARRFVQKTPKIC